MQSIPVVLGDLPQRLESAFRMSGRKPTGMRGGKDLPQIQACTRPKQERVLRPRTVPGHQEVKDVSTMHGFSLLAALGAI